MVKKTVSEPEAKKSKQLTETKKKGSRKGKKAWRKNIDLADVEAGLEALEKEQIIYGSKITEAKDETLFSIETTGDPKVTVKPAAPKQTYVERILSKRSAVPAPRIAPTKKVKTVDSKLVEAAEKVLKASETKKPKPVEFHDIWGNSTAQEKTTEPSAKSFLPPSLTKQAVVSDVELTHSGASYNPSQNALKNIKKLRKEITPKPITLNDHKKTNRLIKVGSISEVLAANSMVTPTDQKASLDEEDSVGERFTAEIKKPLTKKEQRKLDAKRYLEKRKWLKSYVPQLDKDIEKADEIATEVESKLENQATKTFSVKENRKLKAVLPKKKIGRCRVPQKNIAFVYKPTSQLSQIKCEGNLFREQFVSFQARNLIEPIRRDKKIVRTKWTKLINRPGFKMEA